MQLTLNLDDELVAKAQALTGLTDESELVHKALRMLIASENALRLAEAGGTEPELKGIHRRRPPRVRAA